MTSSAVDRRVFEERVVGLLDELLGAALRLAKNRHDAEDLVAETVTRAWAGRRSLRDGARFRPWIFRILTNVFFSDCRKRGARPEADLALGDPTDSEERFSLFEELHQPFLLWWSNPEQEFLNKLLREDIVRAIDGLPKCFRIVVVLADVQGFSYQDIARMLAIPVGTVRSRLARARGVLQKGLWEHAQAAGLRPSAPATVEVTHGTTEHDRV